MAATLKTTVIQEPSSGTVNMTLGSTGGVTFGAAATTNTITSAAATALTIQSAGTTAMTIDTSQNVGIGTSSPSTYGKFTVSDSTSEVKFTLNNTGTGGLQWWIGSTNNSSGAVGGGKLTFYDQTNNVPRMTIDSSNRVIYQTTTSPYNSAQFGSGYGTSYWSFGPQSGSGSFLVQNGSGATGVYISAGNTSWTGTSDENLKNITGTIQNGLEKVATLRAAEFTWKSDENNKPQVGLIAQDVQKVLPEVIDENADGHFGVRYTEVIPLLVAAIQELSAKVTALEAKVGA